MTLSWRISQALLVSSVVHGLVANWSMSRLSETDPLPAPPPIELALLPTPQAAPAAPTEPPPEPERAVVAPPQLPLRSKVAKPQAREPVPSEPEPDITPAQQVDVVTAGVEPVLLGGVLLSNAGPALRSIGAGPSSTHASRASPVRALPTAQARAVPALTPLSDLSTKPTPPPLDAALVRHYPQALRMQGIEGQALIQVELSRDGHVVRTTLMSETQAGFGTACQRALAGSRWTAALTKDGQPTATRLHYRCRFVVD